MESYHNIGIRKEVIKYGQSLQFLEGKNPKDNSPSAIQIKLHKFLGEISQRRMHIGLGKLLTIKSM